jgi:hypothetical protein
MLELLVSENKTGKQACVGLLPGKEIKTPMQGIAWG